MSTMIRDPNAPADPNETRPITAHAYPPDSEGFGQHNPVVPGAPPSSDFPTGVPPTDAEGNPILPPVEEPVERSKLTTTPAPKKK